MGSSFGSLSNGGLVNSDTVIGVGRVLNVEPVSSSKGSDRNMAAVSSLIGLVVGGAEERCVEIPVVVITCGLDELDFASL